AQEARARAIVASEKKTKTARFVKTRGDDRTIDEASLARARGYRNKNNMITMIYLTAAKLPLPTIANPAPDYASAAG
ncbi:MAG: hypothetical protein K0U84_02865, partial [Actinomycetia bacterium]|nr:hypothetical protein [Actinomycetes bacterium]